MMNYKKDIYPWNKGKRGIGQDDRKDGPLDLSSGGANAADASTQLFYVFNPPTQTYEPITIISLGMVYLLVLQYVHLFVEYVYYGHWTRLLGFSVHHIKHCN